jgi:hypothetical protein
VALKEADLVPVAVPDTQPNDPVVAVLQGYGPHVAWTDLAEVAYAVQRGAMWVATNVDSTVPTERGLAPGNGTLIAAVRAAVAVEPVVVGKPYTPLYELSVAVLGTDQGRTLAIGDRLDTDILGATAAGMGSLFVFGGVHGWVDLARADPASRPNFVATDLRALHRPYEEPVQDPADKTRWLCGRASAWISARGEVVVSTTGTLNERVRAGLRALWFVRDSQQCTVDPCSGDGGALSQELDVLAAHVE